MFALARLMVVGFVVLTVIYVCLSLYSRAVRKGKLRAQWHEGPQDQTLDAFLDEGLEDYDKSLRRKLDPVSLCYSGDPCVSGHLSYEF